MVTITTTFQPMRDEQGAVRLSVRRLVLDDDGFSVGVNEQGIEVRGDDETHRRLAQKLAGELLVLLSDTSTTWEQVVLWLAEKGLQNSTTSQSTALQSTALQSTASQDADEPGVEGAGEEV